MRSERSRSPIALREEVLVPDLELVLLPALADGADERGDARLEELDRAHPRPVREEQPGEALAVERLHEAQQARQVLGRRERGRGGRRRSGAPAALVSSSRPSASSEAPTTWPARWPRLQRLGDPPEARHRGDGVDAVAGGLALRHAGSRSGSPRCAASRPRCRSRGTARRSRASAPSSSSRCLAGHLARAPEPHSTASFAKTSPQRPAPADATARRPDETAPGHAPGSAASVRATGAGSRSR